jgi:hypothetical protein
MAIHVPSSIVKNRLLGEPPEVLARLLPRMRSFSLTVREPPITRFPFLTQTRASTLRQ